MKKMVESKLAVLISVSTALFSLNATAQSDVTIYGLLHTSLDRAWTSDATLGTPQFGASQVNPSSYKGINNSINRITSNSSRIGFKGSEELGSGIKLIWQLEGGIAVDSGVGSLFTRNTGMGVSGSFGRVMAGNWDTPYKTLTIPFGGFVTPTAADGNIIGNPGFGIPTTTTAGSPAGTSVDATFDRRQANSLIYWTPERYGFSANLAYAFGEVPTNASAKIISGSVTYMNGPLTLQYGYEQHSDYFGLAQLGGATSSMLNPSSRDSGQKFIAKYVYEKTTLMSVYERLKYKNNDNVVARIALYDRDAWLVMALHRIGAGQIWLAYGKAKDGECERVGGAVCLTNGLGATQEGIGYLYDLSKRSSVYAYYNKLSNKDSGRYGIGVPVVSNEPGTKAQIASFGLVHKF